MTDHSSPAYQVLRPEHVQSEFIATVDCCDDNVKPILSLIPHSRSTIGATNFKLKRSVAKARCSSATCFDRPVDIDPSDQDTLINKECLIKLCRCTRIPVGHECRRWLWLRALHITSDQIEQVAYDTTVKEIYGPHLDADIPTPKFVDHRFVNMFFLSENGIKAVRRVIRVLAYNKPYITYSPLLQPIASICIHYHDEAHSYAILDCLTTKQAHKYEYLTRSVREWFALCDVIVKLTQQYSSPELFRKIKETNIVQEDILFYNWVEWVFSDLPFNELLQVLDCFFIEGLKILVRCAIGATILRTDDESAKVRKRVRLSRHVKKAAIKREITTTGGSTEDPGDSDQKGVLNAGLLLPNLKRSKLYSMLTASEGNIDKKLLDSHARLSTTGNLLNALKRPELAGLKLSMDDANDPNPVATRAPTNILRGTVDFQTKNLTRNQMVEIWKEIPGRIALLTPKLVFSTDIHGRRLMTLFDRLEYSESFILLVRTTENDLVGAYLSLNDVDCWEDLRALISKKSSGGQSRFLGDGETFVFAFNNTCDVAGFCAYHWVGPKTDMVTDRFIKFDFSGMYIGGAGSDFALFVDNQLVQGSSGRSDTFDNPPLVRRSAGAMASDRMVLFRIASLEAFRFEHD